jgi:hypothetical protein
MGTAPIQDRYSRSCPSRAANELLSNSKEVSLMKKLITTASLIALMAAPAIAQDATVWEK